MSSAFTSKSGTQIKQLFPVPNQATLIDYANRAEALALVLEAIRNKFPIEAANSTGIKIQVISSAELNEIQTIRNELDNVIKLLNSQTTFNESAKPTSSPIARYIIEQTILSDTWIIKTLLKYPQCKIYITHMGEEALSQPMEASAQEEFIDEFTIQINLSEPCKGFVVVN